MSKPETIINICSGIPIDNTYKHSLFFVNSNKQLEYFSGKTVKRFSAYSYCRKNWEIKVEASMSQARQWCYLFFRNPDDNKYWYYFITDIQYVSDETVRLNLELDVLQTYLFDMNLQPCFVERMTPRTDEIGDNTVEEGLELGYLVNNSTVDCDDLKYYDLMMMSTLSPRYYRNSDNKIEFHQAVAGQFGEVFSSCGIYGCDVDDTTGSKVSTVLEIFDQEGKTDAIVTMWMYPKKLVKLTEGSTADVSNTTFKNVDRDVQSFEFHFNIPSTIGSYEPKNKKLFTYPFNLLHVHNNAGLSADYRFERFDARNTVYFDVLGSLMPDGAVKLVPRNYNGTGFNHEEGLTLSGFPTCAFSSDAYKIWLAQNQSQHTLSGVVAGGQIIAGVVGMATANPLFAMGGAGMVASGVTSIASLLAQKNDMSTTPPQARGNASASVNASNYKLTFTFVHKSVTPERAKIIDDFFTMYGYKQNRVMNPSIHNRKRFTYVKTVDCLVAGDLCNEDRQKIGSIFDNGVTFWADHEYVGNYFTDNGFLD